MKRILLVAILCCLYTSLFAQEKIVSGSVFDQNTKEPIPGVNIYLKNSNQGTTSSLDGSFSLAIKNDTKTIVFSFIGYEQKEININNYNEDLTIYLKENALELSEVVVTALGFERQTKNLGYPVQKLDNKQVSNVNTPNFTDNLAGRIAGVTVSSGVTGVGSTSKINIRGEASFTNNNPLFIVDGTPINNNTIVNNSTDLAEGFQEIDFGNGAMDINPDDIESVNVLKGPAAAALYGTRASNGVIIITTKSGKNSAGLGLSLNSSFFLKEAFQLPQFQNEYGQGNSGEFAFGDGLGGGVNDVISYSWGPKLNNGYITPQFDSPVTLPNGQVVRGGDVAVHGGAPITPTEMIAYPDNLKDFYQTGYTSIQNIAISNNIENGNYRLSFTDLRDQSIIPGVNLDRKTLRANVGFNPTDKLKVNSHIQYSNSSSDNRPSNGYGSENVNYSIVAWGPRSLDVNALRDYWQPGLEDIQQYSFNYTYFDNPFFTLYENTNSFNRDRIFGNISAQYQFNSKLSLMLRSGMDYSDELRKFKRAFSTNRFKNGAYAEHDVFYREINTDAIINYNDNFGLLGLDFSIGTNRLDQLAITQQAQALSLAQAGIFKLSNSAIPVEIDDFEAQKRINSVFGVAKLSWSNYLFTEITARNDWSSALATPESVENTSFFYPSISTSFIPSYLYDLPNLISFLQLRGSWAQVGNDTNPYQTAGIYNSTTPYMGQPAFSSQSTIPNSNLLPERNTSLEFGTDIRFWQDKLRFDFTYYNTLTENQIIALPVPVSSGYNQQIVNGSKVRSQGIEIIAGLQAYRSTDFNWNTIFNFSRNVSIVEELPDQVDRLTLAYSRIYDSDNQTVWYQVEEGGRLGDMYGTGYLKTDDGQFILDENGNFIADNTLQKLGNYNPDFILAISNDFNYKNFNSSFLLDWRQGGTLVSRTLALGGVGGQLIEAVNRDQDIVAEGVVNVGTEENPVYEPNTTAISPESYYRQYYDRNHEENNTYNASYLKLRQLSIGYDFPQFKSSEAQLSLSLVGRNLWAWSEIPHFDPEQLAIQGNNFVSGVEDMSYASSRSYGVKISLNF
ncbi:SusC/RagA family TonB-linked outer membrane protein [Marivirga arenosa]|uniref:SusC/RagA family TonB-linked outer membrane protein n=1 Tax=Marivirga arenosa TaxID=3059076 RepID=A0AA51ZXH8_9BACT|nr:SusC/RagA family TonB-linked outer membrane protein [Marivirga sp. BKB1-2]WNB18600.1 SusC/RagA family TonB-linked outer membrane protein [Marivirga sp. BKB1-2]